MRITDTNDLKERLELLLLETRAGQAGVFDEMLKIYKEPILTREFTKGQLDNFFIDGE